MPKTRRWSGLFALVSLFGAGLSAQDSTTVPAGTSYETEGAAVVSGVRIEVQPDGSVWFLLPALDRIAVLRGEEMQQWQIRTDSQRGANPVDFEIDGDVVWFLCNGESQIDAGHSIFGRLDTATGQLREWIVPGARPAGFYRAADGKVWIPQTDRRLQSVDLETLEVVDYRSPLTIAYSDVAVGPDGALWMTDFGNNRIVRFEPGAEEESSWTFLDPTLAIFNPSQVQFDSQGRLWISQLTGARMDRFDPATGEITSYVGFVNPIHFDLFGGRVYVTEAAGGNGQIAVLEPLLAPSGSQVLEARVEAVGSLVNARRAQIRDTTITPTTFVSTPEAIDSEDFEVTSFVGGILRTELPWTNAYGIDVDGGEVWVGSTGNLARVVLQTVGSETDLAAPVATQLAGPADAEGRVDVTLSNRSDTPMAGEVLYLFSPGFFAARAFFNLGPQGTAVASDAFGDLGSTTVPINGPVRIRVTSGPADALVATVRSAKAREDGGSFGYSTPAFTGSEIPGGGAERTLFTGGRESETSAFGYYTTSGAEAVFRLVAPDGTVRGTLPISVAANIAEEFSPAASAFGVEPSPGDVIRVSVLSGALLPYVRVVDGGTGDTALSLPLEAALDAVFPSVGTAAGVFDSSFVSDLFLSNPLSDGSAEVTVLFVPLGSPGEERSTTLVLAPGESRVVADLLAALFGVESGQGALLVLSESPIASSVRIASRKEEGDFATFARPIVSSDAVEPRRSVLAIGVAQTATRRTNLLLFNRGGAGEVTIISINGNGDEIARMTLPIGDSEAARVDSIRALLGTFDESNGRLVVEATEGMLLYAVVAEVDGPTGDVEIQPLR